jgi:DNA-binding CsgD family transcriptional regulator
MTPAETCAVIECERAVSVLSDDREACLERMLARVRELLGADASGTYCPERGDSRWQIADGVWCGASFANAALNAAFETYMNRSGDGWSPWYDPDRPDRRQRNGAVALDMAAIPFDYRKHLLEPTGFARHNQVRVLLCDGPALLAWVGGFREEPFTARETRRLTALVPALLRRFRVERLMRDAGLQRAGLCAALEALAVPALIVEPNGIVAHANRNGRAAYDRDPSLRHAFLRGAPPGFEATEIAVRGEPAARLFVKSAAHAELDARVSVAARAWALTLRQAQVLALVARGDGNKLIAAKLGCSLRTAEIHVSNLLRKAGCETRAEVVARLAREA